MQKWLWLPGSDGTMGGWSAQASFQVRHRTSSCRLKTCTIPGDVSAQLAMSVIRSGPPAIASAPSLLRALQEYSFTNDGAACVLPLEDPNSQAVHGFVLANASDASSGVPSGGTTTAATVSYPGLQ